MRQVSQKHKKAGVDSKLLISNSNAPKCSVGVLNSTENRSRIFEKKQLLLLIVTSVVSGTNRSNPLNIIVIIRLETALKTTKKMIVQLNVQTRIPDNHNKL